MQLYKVVPVNRYSLFVICAIYPLLIVHLFCLLFDYLLFSSLIDSLLVQKCNSDPEPCSGISIPLYEKYLLPVDSTCSQHHHLESINIIQQTPPTLS